MMERIVLHIDVNSAFLSWSAVKLLKEGANYKFKKDTIIKVGKVALTLQLIVSIPMLLLCIIGLFCMVNPPLGFDYSDTDKLFLGIMIP